VVTFLFWNLGGKRLEESVSQLAYENAVDILMLSECSIETGVILNALNMKNTPRFELPLNPGRSTVIYTRFGSNFLTPIQDYGQQMTVRKLALPGRIEILLAVAHLKSKLYWSAGSQRDECHVTAERIRKIEEMTGNGQTILVGDLNMNPFEEGVVSAAGFNATMTRTIAARGSRKIQDADYPFFYNPMWAHFGDARGTPPGTFYYDGSQHVTYFWNMFDQVLLRPSLMDRFRDDSLRILDRAGTRSFLTRTGRPSKKAASDHLPIVFSLNL